MNLSFSAAETDFENTPLIRLAVKLSVCAVGCNAGCAKNTLHPKNGVRAGSQRTHDITGALPEAFHVILTPLLITVRRKAWVMGVVGVPFRRLAMKMKECSSLGN